MFEILNEKCAPMKATKYSACVDLRANANMSIDVGETKLIPLGIKIDLVKLRENWEELDIGFGDNSWHDFLLDHFFALFIRSGITKNLIIKNGVGVIDLDFPDEMMIRVYNDGMKSVDVCIGDRVAQGTIINHLGRLMGYETDTVRLSGLGSTGIK